jgi:phosphoserine phosphatase
LADPKEPGLTDLAGEPSDEHRMISHPHFRSVVLDVDSTLCGVEGVDWLAAQRGDDVARRTRALTERAMNGEIPLDAVYGERLGLISPTKSDIDALSRVYRETLATGAREAIAAMRAAGVRVVLVSGGLRQAIAPLAQELGVELHAVDVRFDSSPTGGGYAYTGFDHTSQLATQTGKLEVVRSLALERPALAVGDGATDLAMRDAVDHFAAFTGFVAREKVIEAAESRVASFSELRKLVLGGG